MKRQIKEDDLQELHVHYFVYNKNRNEFKCQNNNWQNQNLPSTFAIRIYARKDQIFSAKMLKPKNKKP